MKLQFATVVAFNTAHNALGGNNFKYDNYRADLALKFFTTESVRNAIFDLTSKGLVEGRDFTFNRYADQ